MAYTYSVSIHWKASPRISRRFVSRIGRVVAKHALPHGAGPATTALAALLRQRAESDLLPITPGGFQGLAQKALSQAIWESQFPDGAERFIVDPNDMSPFFRTEEALTSRQKVIYVPSLSTAQTFTFVRLCGRAIPPSSFSMSLMVGPLAMTDPTESFFSGNMLIRDQEFISMRGREDGHAVRPLKLRRLLTAILEDERFWDALGRDDMIAPKEDDELHKYMVRRDWHAWDYFSHRLGLEPKMHQFDYSGPFVEFINYNCPAFD